MSLLGEVREDKAPAGALLTRTVWALVGGAGGWCSGVLSVELHVTCMMEP